MTNGEERPLYLHISALSPDEYQLYTDVLTELAGPGQDDSQGVWDRPVDVMEARGWIRGRYGLDAGMVDKILRYFQTSRNGAHNRPQEVLSAGQFFAVMRLVLHAQAGREPAKTLAFVQPTVLSSLSNDSRTKSPVPPPPQRKTSLSNRTPSKPPTLSGTPMRARGPSDPIRSTPGTPSHALSTSNDDATNSSPAAGSHSANPFRRAFSSIPDKSAVSSPGSSPEPVDAKAAPLPPVPITAPPVHPLSRSAISQRDTHVPPPQRDDSLAAFAADCGDRDREETHSDTALSAAALRRSNNPFNGAAQPVSVPASLAATPLAQSSPAMPPVPPRKPPALPPRTSDATAATLIAFSPSLPPRPPKTSPGGSGTSGNGPLPPINSSSLIKESLRAAKGAQAQKASETLLEKTLNWEVIKRSSSRDAPSSGPTNDVGKGPSGRNTSPTRPPPPLPPQPRRTAPSPPISASSMEVLASASLPTTPQNRFIGASSGIGTGMSSGPGLGRSKSMHHQTSPSVGATMQSSLLTDQQKTSPVPPPPPRRRPESFQALPAYGGALADAGGIGIGYLPSFPPDGRGLDTALSRRASIQSNFTHSTDASGSNNGSGPNASMGGEKGKERAGRGGDAFAHLYESVKKRAEGFQRGAQPGLENMRRMAERAEGRVVPGGYLHPRRGSSHPPGSERRGLVHDGSPGDGDDDDYGKDAFGDDEEWRTSGVDRDSGNGGPGVDVDVDVDDREWREWDRTVRRNDHGRRGGRSRPRLSNSPGMDDGEGDSIRRPEPLSPQGDGWRRL